MVCPIAHMAEESRETSVTGDSPVRSLWKRAMAMPPAMVIAPIESPKPGPGGGVTKSESGCVTAAATPERAQNERLS